MTTISLLIFMEIIAIIIHINILYGKIHRYWTLTQLVHIITMIGASHLTPVGDRYEKYPGQKYGFSEKKGAT